jgi:acyl carrier protein
MTDPIQRIHQFIIDKHDGPAVFTDTDDLIENGLIDSLQFVEFVMLIAELSGRDILLDDLKIDEIRTIAAIRATFFEAPLPRDTTASSGQAAPAVLESEEQL